MQLFYKKKTLRYIIEDLIFFSFKDNTKKTSNKKTKKQY